MNDKHVAILLRNYRRQIEDTIDRVREAIPTEAGRYEVKNILGNVIFSDYVALEPLHTLTNRIDEDIATLKGKGADNG